MDKKELDVRRLLCPMPVIKTQQAIKKMETGQQLEVIATDPGVVHDIPSWCRISGHKVLENRQEGLEYIILIEVGER